MMAPSYARISEYLVDLDALARLSHSCDPSKCVGDKSCCATYDVPATEDECDRMTGMLPLAARYQPTLRDGDGFVETFDEDEEISLATDEDGRCVFAFRGKDKGERCSLHAAALDVGVDPYRSKPMPCALWPLALTDDDVPVLTVMAGVGGFPCNRGRPRRASLHPGVADILATCFGPTFRDAVVEAVAKG